MAAWLDRSTAPTILRNLAGKRLTHDTLDDLPAGKTVEHLRSVLVAIGTLPARDEQMTRVPKTGSSSTRPTAARLCPLLAWMSQGNDGSLATLPAHRTLSRR